MKDVFTNESVLGICIPTYNRAEILKDNITNIIKYIGNYGIPIYISDNCSTDNTTEIVNIIKETYPNIIYSKNDKNLGSDKNFEIVLKMCQESYAWLLGDDDTIDSDIRPILEILKLKNPDVMVLGTDKNISEGIYSDKFWILNQLSLQMTWLSGNIIANRLIRDFDFKRYYDTHFIHAGTILDYIGRVDDISLLYNFNHYVRYMRAGYVAYADKILEIYAKGWTEVIIKLPGFSFEEKLKQCRYRTKRTGMLNNRILLSMRAQGCLNHKKLREYRNYIKLYNNSPYFLLFIISIFPRNISKVLRKLYKSFFA